MDQKEFNEMMEKGKDGWLECCYCIHYEEFAFPREGDFEEWCEKKENYIKNCNYETGCKYFDMGDPKDWN